MRYIFKYIHQEKREAQAPFIIRHNVRSTDVRGFTKEFTENAARRVHARRDQTLIHHTILSWSNKDREKITPEMIRRMASQYIRLRGENNLYVGAIHTDRDHIHLHLAMSGNQINGLSSRISQRQFFDLKCSLDAFQRELYPELDNSLPEHGKGKTPKGLEPPCAHTVKDKASEHLSPSEISDVEQLKNIRVWSIERTLLNDFDIEF